VTGHAGGRGRKTTNAKTRARLLRVRYRWPDGDWGLTREGPLWIDGREYTRRLRARRKRRR
jgi:hypothetical protein